jgi:hypothetical protein
MASQQPVLDLDTLADRPTVIFGKKEYRLWSSDLLPPLDNHRVRKLIRRIDEIALKDGELTKAEENELKKLFDEVTRVVLDAPDAVHKKLTDKHRAEIIRTFQMPSLDLLLKVLAAAQAQGATAAPPTGETSPLGSAGSTQP